MYYTHYKYNGKAGDVMLAGVVQVQPIAGEDDVEVVQVIPDEYQQVLESEIYGKEFAALDSLPNPEPFNPHRADHWSALPNIFRISSGYGGIEEYSDEEFLEFAKSHGYKEEAGATD